MKYRWAAGTHVGRVRKGNEDAIHPEIGGAGDGPFVTAVADGMGGHVGGEVASHTALEAALAVDGSAAERVLAANRALLDRVASDPELAGMGTTLTLGVVEEDGALTIGHVGDSRAYLFRDGALHQITTDHSLVAEMIAAGRLSEEEAASHPQRNIITRSLGLTPDVQVDSYQEQLRAGDRLLICSDGLNGMVGDDVISGVLGSADSTAEAVWTLIEAANAAGGGDNVSVIVVDVRE